MSSEPLVSCIMPTLDNREAFRRFAMDCFDRQDYGRMELICLSGPGTIGEKRNQAISTARGEIIVHWDDDDWSAPDRVSSQVRKLIQSGAEITGYRSMYFLDEDGQWWLYSGSSGYALGTSLCYWKEVWRKRTFAGLQVGEDNDFIRGRKLVSEPAGDRMFARIHAANTSDKVVQLGSQEWKKVDHLEVPQRLIDGANAYPYGYTIIILSKNSENLLRLLNSLRRNGEYGTVIVVDDGLAFQPQMADVHYVGGLKPFVFSRNVNIGALNADKTHDLVVLNDDTELLTQRGIHSLVEAAREQKAVVSAAIREHVGNVNQMPRNTEGYRPEKKTLAFIAVAIPREIWARVGSMDERFDAYGCEDNDYCHRVQRAGYGLGVWDPCIMAHDGTPTFRSRPDIKEALMVGRAIYVSKWGEQP